MSDFSNLALAHFLKTLSEELIWGQVLIRRAVSGFELRHSKDRNAESAQLKTMSPPQLHELALYNSLGQFRPLKSAPDLRTGWTVQCRSEEDLGFALNRLYPNSIVDWYSATVASAPVTHYREFTNRQAGMYRITQMLDDEQAGNVIRAACHQNFCLKRRLWTVQGLPVDGAQGKSAIPCLEPCAILLELARKTMRSEQEEKLTLQLSRSDLETLLSSAKEVSNASLTPAGEIGEAGNPRRVQLVLEKLRSKVGQLSSIQPEG